MYNYVLARAYANLQTFLVSADCELDVSHICREIPVTNTLLVISIRPTADRIVIIIYI